ncbi:MAG: phenylalanyl-tRNA synthetase alpha chain [Kribbellaceae bacterium]|jgi:phenylalanyl-tRNA synthetase alpha chain|nr:phenylalanyl-tRNA synthetase alpha chain [Kribbellaceae bacterium]
MAVLTAEELNDNLALRDLADPAQGPHGIQLVVDQIRAALGQAWPYTEIWTRRDHPVVSLADNYDNLGYAAGAVTREERYTRYASPTQVLRSHTSAMIPPALRELAASKEASDVLMVCAGICYRRDSVDWQHTGTPHQLDLWRISRNVTLGEPELEAMIAQLVETVLPGQTYRTVPAVHPYTIHGRQIDVLLDDQWIEIGECGVAAPAVLRKAGLDESWTGLAMGPGLDRLLMLRKGIRDIRLLRSTDPRVAEQMLDLSPYKPVSAMPAVRRDLSVVVGPDVDISDEVLGDRVRQALGVDAEAAESVEVRGETSYDDLPVAARERLQLTKGQRNVLIRLILRPVDRTLTDGEANQLRDQVYSALHEGPVLELIGR